MSDFYHLFLDQTQDIYNAEHQITKALPKLIKKASLPKLKEGLKTHLNETKQQIVRLKKVFALLKMKPKQKTCPAMKGLLEEGSELSKLRGPSPLLDAAIIAAAQKVEHYEIATYGTLRSFAKHLNLDGEISTLLQNNLDEEGEADKLLTSIAEGSFFTTSVNEEAAHIKKQTTARKKASTGKNAKKVATRKKSPLKKKAKKSARKSK